MRVRYWAGVWRPTATARGIRVEIGCCWSTSYENRGHLGNSGQDRGSNATLHESVTLREARIFTGSASIIDPAPVESHELRVRRNVWDDVDSRPRLLGRTVEYSQSSPAPPVHL